MSDNRGPEEKAFDRRLTQDQLRSLKRNTNYHYDGAKQALLDWFPNPQEGEINLEIDIIAPEFTSLCPITGQPDFATIKITYRPNERCVESKSLKLYLGSYRQEGMFHEVCVNKILVDLCNILHPKWIRVVGEFSPRGGIKFWPTASWQE